MLTPRLWLIQAEPLPFFLSAASFASRGAFKRTILVRSPSPRPAVFAPSDEYHSGLFERADHCRHLVSAQHVTAVLELANGGDANGTRGIS